MPANAPTTGRDQIPRHYLVGASQTPAQPSEPAIKLSLGWPSGIKAEMSIDSGWIRRALRALWFAPLSERIHLVGAHVEISVPEDDAGRLQCVLALANFCFRPVTVTSIHVDFLTIGNGSLSDFNPHPEQPDFVIPRRGVGEVAFSHRLGGGEIRDLQRFVGQASYPKSSPTASTGLRGTLSLRHWRGAQQVTFAVTGIVPLLIMYNPANKAST